MRRRLLDFHHPDLSVSQQCTLLSLPRSTAYYPPREADPEDLLLMRLLDEQYLTTPFYGVRRFTNWLREQGYDVGLKRIRRLLHTLGLEAIYPRPHLSHPSPEHRVYPYLLRGLAVVRPDQVWCSDITYIRMRRGFAYLVAVMDWYSRYVLAWRLSNTLDAAFCVDAVAEALRQARPEIFNTDQGSQFTSSEFVRQLNDISVSVSMDGRGRCFDNIFIERLWRSVKCEEVYLHDYADLYEAEKRLGWYFGFYNHERRHQGLGDRTPWTLYKEAFCV